MGLRFLFVLFLVILNRSAFSTDITINGTSLNFNDNKSNNINLNENWRFAIGDNLDWANPSFDHSKWDTAYLPLTIESLLPFHYAGNVWFRSTFQITKDEAGKSLAFIIKQFGASEIFIDGKLIQRFGKIGNSISTEEAYDPKNNPSSFVIDSIGTHIIAIRYSNHQISTNKLETELEAFDLQIATVDDVSIESGPLYIRLVKPYISGLVTDHVEIRAVSYREEV